MSYRPHKGMLGGCGGGRRGGRGGQGVVGGRTGSYGVVRGRTGSYGVVRGCTGYNPYAKIRVLVGKIRPLYAYGPVHSSTP